MFVIVLLFVLLTLHLINKKEHFRLFYYSSPSTRNMSYDLRCEPRIPKRNTPFMGSSIMLPPQIKCLDI